MAINPTRTPFPLQGAGIGGGVPPTSVALDPRGLVPIDRAQPLATDGVEPQRIMERRTGAMPPTSFSGAGAGFVPLDRSLPIPQNLAESRTDYGNAVVPTGQPVAPSAAAMRRTAVAQGLGVPGGAPATPGISNVAAQGLANRNPRATAAIEAARARMAARPIPGGAPGGQPPMDRMQRLREALARGRTRATGLLGRIGG